MEFKTLDKIHLIKLEGSVLQSDSQRIERYFFEIFSSENKNVIIDLSEANHISSSVLGQIVFMKNKLKHKSGDLKLVATDEDLLELFELTMLNKVFQIYSDLETAIESFN